MALAASLLLLLACTPASSAPVNAQPPAPQAVDDDRALFERRRVEGGFARNAYVVWSPVWPTSSDEVTVLYDTTASLARFHGGAPLTWFLTPESGDALTRTLAVGAGGVARLTERASALRPGWFVFGRGELRDNDCGNPWKLPVVPEPPRWREATSAHFRYRWLPGDPVEGRIREVLEALEAHLAGVVEAVGLALPSEPVVFLHYATRELGFAYQAHHGNNADELRHLVFSAEAPDDAHELTHLLVAEQLGRHHQGLFDEGLATHLGQERFGHGWQGRPCDDWAREGIEHRDLPPLASIATSSAFYAVPWTRTGGVLFYGAACSFVADLLARHGPGKVRSLLQGLTCETQDDAHAVAARFEADFGVSLEAADAAWHTKITSVANAGGNAYESASPEVAARWKRVRLPLPKGTRFLVSQGAFGGASHGQKGIEYRWDFDVPYGTGVVAVEGGRVLAVHETHQPGGCDPKFSETPNSILVEHADGTVAQYVHVESRVKVGRQVAAGDVIAVTARNGFICTPQLDFLVYRSRETLYDSPARESIPLRFIGLPREMATRGVSALVP
jgi:hypothetical protein